MEFPIVIHSQAELNYIAHAVAMQIRVADQVVTDQQFQASLPLDEQKRLSRIRVAQIKAERKREAGAGRC